MVRLFTDGRFATIGASGLPLYPSVLVGRDDEIPLIDLALRSHDVRLLTLSGAPGVGKTRLAVEAARRVADDFPDGIWFVDLATVAESDQVATAIAEELDLWITPELVAPMVLQQFLLNKRFLLVLDTFEHVLSAASLVDDLLSWDPGLCLLITSRQPLRLKWEHVFTVDPLPVPAPSEDESLEETARSPAVQLFVQHAQAVRVDFALTSANAGDIAAITRELDGVPLAIELAAGWTHLLAPSAIREYLSRQFSLLHRTTRDIPSRQQSLDAALDWSYDLLQPGEQTLLRRLSVCVGGFTVGAAVALGAGGEVDVLDLLAGLVDKSLIQHQFDDGGEEGNRFWLLHTIRSYALERLEERDDRAKAERRHAEYYLAYAERESASIRHVGDVIATRIRQRPADAWGAAGTLDALEQEYINLRAALQWTRRAGDYGMELRLGSALAPFWWLRTAPTEGTHWLVDALEHARDVGGATRIRALNGAAMLLRRQGKVSRARELLEEALAGMQGVEDSCLLGGTLMNLAIVQPGISLTRIEAARTIAEEALSVYRESEDAWGVAAAQLHLAMVEVMAGHGAAAEALLTEAQAVLDDVGDLRSSAVALAVLAPAVTLQGNAQRASLLLAGAVRLCRDHQDRKLIAACTDVASWMASDDDPLRSATFVGASDGLRQSGVARPVFEQYLHVETMRRLKTHLSEEVIEAAQQEGRPWSMEKTIEQILVSAESAGHRVDRYGRPFEAETAPRLLERELEVVRLMSEGMSNQEIADTLFVSEGTVKVDIRSVYQKLKVHNRAQAIRIVVEHGLI